MSYIFESLLFIFFAWFTGSIICSFFNKISSYNCVDFIIKIVLGYILNVSLFAIAKSGGKTVLIGILIIGIVALIRNRDLLVLPKVKFILKSIPTTLHSSQWYLFILHFVFFAIWQILSIHPFDSKNVLVPNRDVIYYSEIARHLFQYGSENTLGLNNDLFNSVHQFRSPYHYFEEWTAAFLSSIFKESTLNTITFHTPLIILSISSFLLYSIFKSLNIKSFIVYLSPVLLFLNPIYFTEVLSGVRIFTFPIITAFKLQVYYLFLLTTIVLYILNKKNAIYIYVCLPFVTISSLPAVFGSLFMLTIYQLIMKNLKLFYAYLLLLLTCIFIIFSFYYLFSIKGQSINIDLLPRDFKTRLHILIGGSFQIFVVYLIFLLIITAALITARLRLSVFSRFKDLLFIMLSSLICGLLSWVVLFPMLDSIQLYSNYTSTSLNIFFILFIVLIIQYQKKRVSIYLFNAILVTILVINIFNAYQNNISYTKNTLVHNDLSLIRKIQNLKKGGILTNNIGISWKEGTDYSNVFTSNESCDWPGTSLKMADNNLIAVPISSFSILKNIDDFDRYERLRRLNNLYQSPFYYFVKSKMQNNLEHINEDSIKTFQLNFLDKYDVQFAITNVNRELPTYLQMNFSKFANDSTLGYSFYLRNDVYRKYLNMNFGLSN